MPETRVAVDHKAKIREYFDEDSNRYERLRYGGDYKNCHQYSYLVRKSLVLRMLEGGARILDIGCGPGVYTTDLLARGFKVWGLDIAPKMVEKATAKFAGEIVQGNASFSVGEIHDLAGKESFFDAILCVGVISYVTDLETFLAKLSSLIRPGGYAIIQISKKYSPKAFDEQFVYPTVRTLRSLLTLRRPVREWDFNLSRYTTKGFNRLCAGCDLELETGAHFDYTLPLLSSVATRLNLLIAKVLESHTQGLLAGLLAGDYVGRYRKNA